MQILKLVLAIAPLASLVLAAPVVEEIEKRQGGIAVTCGTKSYTATQVNKAINNARSGSYSSSGYPHTYNDYEGFDFSDYCSDTAWKEYPLSTASGGYTGGSPGADRVIYGTSSGKFCGAITHTGASGNNFVQCYY
ncbi:ribonuclease-domain-containing protein [Violaceomyces palustris]|uniref:Ribonuclease-domain-containing protein n=1 Tax=Violaceomyces palustris TaxID=1673888 RepID=A0ACD0NRM6_9BASI|nr:ribonuclease-domain-containing protein [Violaceomyces palustris]